MSAESLKLVKNHLEASMGDLGIRIYQKSISKLNISVNPSRKEIDNLISHLEKMVAKLYGNNRSKAIFGNIRRELTDFDKFYDKFFGSKIKDTLDNFFEMKGIPGEVEIQQVAKFLMSSGYEQNEKNLVKMLKQYSKERIIWAMHGSIINIDIITFLNFNPTYTQIDVENFINQLKMNKLDVNDVDIKDKIEKERLFRKFNYTDRKETEEEKITRQCIALFNSNNKLNYEYILFDEELIRLMKQIGKAHS